MKYNNELQFEDDLYNYLSKVGGTKQWQQLDDVHTTDDLWNNFRKIVYDLNQDKLDQPLSNGEFIQVKEQILNQTKTPYQAGVFLYGVGGKSQVEIDRDDGKHVYLTIFDQDQIGAGRTIYQVVKQIERDYVVQGKKDRRFDVTLLINGLPIIQIEEKADGHDAKEALNQMHQYIGENQYSGIFSTIQILIAMTPHDVRYMANAADNDFNTDFAFQWKKNQSKQFPIYNWKEFVNEFLSIPMAHKMATNYMILDNTKNHQSIKAMRYYQVYATQKVIEQVKNHDFDGLGDNRIGYVWHTTGSGKTISSFKTAFLASRLPNVDKVVFLVDRVALTNQTAEKYQAYDPNSDENNHGGVVLDTANVSDLKKKLKTKSNKDIIVTSIQKLDKLVSNQNFSIDDKRILFIVDEAHRSTGGKMLQEIKKAFKKSAWVGYTGTPNFDDNGPKTADIFGEPLHRYVISDAIADHNVLGFQVDFQTTLSEDELKNHYLPQYYAAKNPKWNEIEIQDKIDHLNPAEMDEEVNSSVYDMQPAHISEVVQDILKYWETRSVNRQYNALMTTKVGGNKPSIPMALEYYDEFKKQMKSMDSPLKIGITFSYDNSNGDNQKENNEGLERVMKDYNQQFKTNFDATTVKEYTNDLVSRLDKSASDQNYLDLVIVVDQLLTGFDAPQLNTLYVDRILKGANLIQAYSRTNRVKDMQSKPFGHIVNYRWPHYSEQLMNEALSTYANAESADQNEELLDDEPSDEIVVKYANIKSELNKIVPELNEKTDGFMQVPPSDRDKEAIYPKLNQFNHLVAQAKQFDEYQDDGDNQFLNEIGLDEDQEARLTGPIANGVKEYIAQKRKIDPIELDLKMEHIKEVEVNYDYLNDLLAEYTNHIKNDDLEADQLDKIKTQIYQQLDVFMDKDPKYVNQIKAYIESDINNYVKETNLTGQQMEKIITDFGRIDSLDKITEFIKYWGLKTNDQESIQKLIDQHEVGADDLNQSDELKNITVNGQDNYQENANEQVKNMKRISYRTSMRKALRKLADHIKNKF